MTVETPAPEPTVHVVLPAGVDDPARPSGGNVYDRRVLDGLTALGWTVHEHEVAGPWPLPGPDQEQALSRVLARIPDAGVVLVDGLVGSASAAALLPESERLRLVVLLHMPLAEAEPGEAVRRSEARVLSAAAAVVTASHWARGWIVEHHAVPAERVHVAEPGADPAPPAAGSGRGDSLLCVAAVTPGKGHDTLLDALEEIQDLEWECVCVGALDLEPTFVEHLRATALRSGIADRVSFPGPLTGAALDAAYAGADLVVSASRRESYGMAVTEALARSLPVIVTDVGGHAEAVGRADDDSVPGVLVPADDPDRLAEELRRWLTDEAFRKRLRRSAARRRTGLRSWADTARRLAEVLAGVRVNPSGPAPVSLSTTHET